MMEIREELNVNYSTELWYSIREKLNELNEKMTEACYEDKRVQYNGGFQVAWVEDLKSVSLYLYNLRSKVFEVLKKAYENADGPFYVRNTLKKIASDTFYAQGDYACSLLNKDFYKKHSTINSFLYKFLLEGNGKMTWNDDGTSYCTTRIEFEGVDGNTYERIIKWSRTCGASVILVSYDTMDSFVELITHVMSTPKAILIDRN